MASPGLIPELDVRDLDRSLAFYVGILGFRVWFDRPEERFAYLVLDDAHVMLEEAAGPGRRFRTAPLEHPYGRGVNLMIRAADAAALHDRILAAGLVPYLQLEERWYIGSTQSRMAPCNSSSPIRTAISCNSSPTSGSGRDRPERRPHVCEAPWGESSPR